MFDALNSGYVLGGGEGCLGGGCDIGGDVYLDGVCGGDVCLDGVCGGDVCLSGFCGGDVCLCGVCGGDECLGGVLVGVCDICVVIGAVMGFCGDVVSMSRLCCGFCLCGCGVCGC